MGKLAIDKDGFTMWYPDGEMVSAPHDIGKGDTIHIRFRNGEVVPTSQPLAMRWHWYGSTHDIVAYKKVTAV